MHQVKGKQRELLYGMISQMAGGGGSGLGMYAGARAGAGKAFCCFNFLEAEGEIHSAVRKYRDQHYAKDGMVGRGYRRSAKLFVPLMKKYKSFKQLIRLTMTKPLKSYAQWFYGENRYGFIFWPMAKGWVNCWRLWGVR